MTAFCGNFLLLEPQIAKRVAKKTVTQVTQKNRSTKVPANATHFLTRIQAFGL